MTSINGRLLPVTVPVDATFDDLVSAYERLWKIAIPQSIRDVTYCVEDMRPDLALRVVDVFDHNGPGVLYVCSLSRLQIEEEPLQMAEQQARDLAQLLERIGWWKLGSTPPRPLEPRLIGNARRIAEKARRLKRAHWPCWSTSELIVAALAAGSVNELPRSYRQPGEAWHRLSDEQRIAVREVNPQIARYCEGLAGEID